MPTEHLSIGKVAQRAGVSTRALRYYEEQGLLQPQRTPSGQRVFPASAVARVQLIQQLFGAGLSSPLLAALLPAIDARHLGPELSARLLAEHERLESEVATLQAASGSGPRPPNRSCASGSIRPTGRCAVTSAPRALVAGCKP